MMTITMNTEVYHNIQMLGVLYDLPVVIITVPVCLLLDGNKVPGCETFDLCFGGRRHFCRSNYADLGEA